MAAKMVLAISYICPSSISAENPSGAESWEKKKEKQQKKTPKYMYREWREGDRTPRQWDCREFGPLGRVLLERSELEDVDHSMLK